MTEFDHIKGERPTSEHTWCDECCRWEHDSVKRIDRKYLSPRGYAAVLYAISGVFRRIGSWMATRAELAFIRDNARRGVLIEQPK